MGDHLVLYVDHLIKPPTSESIDQTEVPESSGEGSAIQCLVSSGSSISSGHPRDDKGLEEPLVPEEEESFIKTVECRICQEEDHINNLETPCACSGSLKVSLALSLSFLYSHVNLQCEDVFISSFRYMVVEVVKSNDFFIAEQQTNSSVIYCHTF